MGNGTKKCKVCGAEYIPCKNPHVGNVSGNRWQDVACCVEHAAEYFDRVAKSRFVANDFNVDEDDDQASADSRTASIADAPEKSVTDKETDKFAKKKK